MKRSRGRGRRPQNNTNRTFDSTGPEIKIRGSAAHVYEKYLQLARDANSVGDRVMAENYLQHAEHYYRIMSAAQLQQQQQQQQMQQQGQHNGGNGRANGNGAEGLPQGGQGIGGPSFSQSEDEEDDDEGAAAD